MTEVTQQDRPERRAISDAIWNNSSTGEHGLTIDVNAAVDQIIELRTQAEAQSKADVAELLQGLRRAMMWCEMEKRWAHSIDFQTWVDRCDELAPLIAKHSERPDA